MGQMWTWGSGCSWRDVCSTTAAIPTARGAWTATQTSSSGKHRTPLTYIEGHVRTAAWMRSQSFLCCGVWREKRNAVGQEHRADQHRRRADAGCSCASVFAATACRSRGATDDEAGRRRLEVGGARTVCERCSDPDRSDERKLRAGSAKVDSAVEDKVQEAYTRARGLASRGEDALATKKLLGVEGETKMLAETHALRIKIAR
eukprot:204983-Rhodomonas_salina.2